MEEKEEYHKRRYREDPEFRAKVIARSRRQYQERKANPELWAKELRKRRENYATIKSLRLRMQAYFRERYRKLHPNARRYNKPYLLQEQQTQNNQS